MLSYFPVMYPDEILYSVIARYHKYSGNAQVRQTINDLFGNKSDSSSVILPAHLNHFSEQVFSFGISFEELLYNRTLFPFFALFQSDQFIQNVIKWTEENSGKTEFDRYAMWRKSAQTSEHLRYCPACLVEDSKRYGEQYWHRQHQIIGVSVCTSHKTVLCDSNIPYASYRSKAYFCPTELATSPVKNPEQLNDAEMEIAVQIANEIQWLFDNFATVHNLWIKNGESFRDIYLFFLSRKGLTTPGGSVRTRQFKTDFTQYYGKYLNLWELDFSISKQSCWPIKMLRSETRQFSFLRHVLMMKYLGSSLGQFFDMIHLYEEEPISKETTNLKTNTSDINKREKYRRIWQTTCEEFPDDCQNDIRLLIPAVYTWLIRHDNEWFYKNSPAIRNRTRRPVCKRNVDWTERDEALLAKLKFVVENELQSQKRPTRITTARLGYSTGAINVFRKGIENLPKSEEYLAQAIETRDSYRKRKLIWGANLIINNNEPIVMWKLMKVAGIPDKMWEQYWEFFQKEQRQNYIYPLEMQEMSNQ